MPKSKILLKLKEIQSFAKVIASSQHKQTTTMTAVPDHTCSKISDPLLKLFCLRKLVCRSKALPKS